MRIIYICRSSPSGSIPYGDVRLITSQQDLGNLEAIKFMSGISPSDPLDMPRDRHAK
jgi:hypothetical protein